MKKNRTDKEWVKRLWGFYGLSILVIMLFFWALSAGFLGFMPSFEELENPRSKLASEVVSADQVVLGTYFIENRSNVSYVELSPWLIKSLVATEDIRFQKHSGIDSKALARAILGIVTTNNKGGGSTITQQLAKNLFPREEYHTFLGTGYAKLREWITAIKLERHYTKEEIIALYFNTVDFGSQAYGIKSAAKTYFDKSPAALNIQESAMLVGMLKAPTWFHPKRNPDRAKLRREVVLNQMVKYNYLTGKQYDSVRKLPLDMSHFSIQDYNSGLATYFREQMRQMLLAEKPNRANYADYELEDYAVDSVLWETDPIYGWIKKNKKPDGSYYNLFKDGLRIYTTIDSRMQIYAEQALVEHLSNDLQPAFFQAWKGNKFAPFDLTSQKEINKLLDASKRRSDRYRLMKKAGISEDSITLAFNTPVPMTVFSWKGDFDTIMTPMDSIKYHKWFLQAGVMSMEPQTGYVRAFVGGINYKHFKYDHVIVGHRQVGSTFKPFVYTVALQDGGMTASTLLPNVPITIQTSSGPWSPKNSGHYREGEMVTLREALANSINWISAALIDKFKPQSVIKVARQMGITSPLPAVPSICLGTADISLYEMVGAMNTYANKGFHIEPICITRIEDKNGNVIAEFSPRQNEAMNEITAYMMIELLKGVVDGGTGARLRYRYGFTNPIAGKTGTTQNNSDGWFMGLTPDLVTGVWVGGDDRTIRFRNMALGQGANMALPIWALYMKKVYADKKLQVSKGDFERPEGPLPTEEKKPVQSNSSGSYENDDRF